MWLARVELEGCQHGSWPESIFFSISYNIVRLSHINERSLRNVPVMYIKISITILDILTNKSQRENYNWYLMLIYLIHLSIYTWHIQGNNPTHQNRVWGQLPGEDGSVGNRDGCGEAPTGPTQRTAPLTLWGAGPPLPMRLHPSGSAGRSR